MSNDYCSPDMPWWDPGEFGIDYLSGGLILGPIAGVTSGAGRALIRVGARGASRTVGRVAKPVVDVAARRVYLRVGTRRAIEAASRKTSNGLRFIDPYTDEVIDGAFHYGHNPGYEWWRTSQLAREQGWTRRQLIEYENNPAHYSIQSPGSNLSHRYERGR